MYLEIYVASTPYVLLSLSLYWKNLTLRHIQVDLLKLNKSELP